MGVTWGDRTGEVASSCLEGEELLPNEMSVFRQSAILGDCCSAPGVLWIHLDS